MKKHRLLLLVALLAGLPCIYGATRDSLTLKVERAIALASGFDGQIDYKASFNGLQNLAEQGHPMAMNALGRLYFEGKGCAVDTTAGLHWLNCAGDAGYYAAWHNLGTIYKYGRSGVQQDFALSFYYFDKAAQAPNSTRFLGQYDAGFMLYKGLGCTQNYTKAYTYFKASAEGGFVPSMYMLALCYRNGYGVERQTGEAGFWISQAAMEGYTPAVEEFHADGPENTPVRVKVRSTSISPLLAVPERYREVSHLRRMEVNQLDGDYEGVLATYDWSGKIVVKEIPLSLSITTIGRSVKAEWREQGADTVTVSAEWRDSSLIFLDASQSRRGRYDAGRQQLWSFSNARLQLLQDDTASYLAGNLQMYSLESLEPNQPMYLSLRKVTRSQINVDETFHVYPNPFENALNISFNQPVVSEVKVAVYTTGGQRLYLESLGVIGEGQQDITLSLSLAPGVYLLKLTTGDKSHQTVIVHK